MINCKAFAFNPFQVNCYLVWDETNETVIVDASCVNKSEQEQLLDFIKLKQLIPVLSVFTHCHTDHVAGADFVYRRFKLAPVIHKAGLPILKGAAAAGKLYGMNYPDPPEPGLFVSEGDKIRFGKSVFEVIYTPGHVDGSICLYCPLEAILISGDVLFNGSIGRTDLPTGDYNALIENIQTKLMVLPGETRVLPGHGAETSIGAERQYNPFL